MPGALRALHRLGVDPPGQIIAGITYRQGDTIARARFRRGVGRGVRRIDLHHALRAVGTISAFPVHDRTVSRVDPYVDHVSADGLRARYLVAADGLHSPIRAAVGLVPEATASEPCPQDGGCADTLRSRRTPTRWRSPGPRTPRPT